MPQTNIDHLNQEMPTLSKKRSEKKMFFLSFYKHSSEQAGRERKGQKIEGRKILFMSMPFQKFF